MISILYRETPVSQKTIKPFKTPPNLLIDPISRDKKCSIKLGLGFRVRSWCQLKSPNEVLRVLTGLTLSPRDHRESRSATILEARVQILFWPNLR